MNGNTYFNFRFYNPLFSGSRLGSSDINIDTNNFRCISKVQLLNYRLGSPVTSGVTRRQSPVYFVRGFSTPILRIWVQKSTLLFKNRGHAEVLKKTPSSTKYVTRVRPPFILECYHRGSFVMVNVPPSYESRDVTDMRRVIYTLLAPTGNRRKLPCGHLIGQYNGD